MGGANDAMSDADDARSGLQDIAGLLDRMQGCLDEMDRLRLPGDVAAHMDMAIQRLRGMDPAARRARANSEAIH